MCRRSPNPLYGTSTIKKYTSAAYVGAGGKKTNTTYEPAKCLYMVVSLGSPEAME